jgi:hypothetical protein
MHIVSQAKYYIEIRFEQSNGDSSCVAWEVNRWIEIFDDLSFIKVIQQPIKLGVTFHLISVSNMWDMMIRLGTCKGQMGDTAVLDSKSLCLMTDGRDIVLPITVKLEN